eukprot:10421061-Karenia_brevis.AAC.1
MATTAPHKGGSGMFAVNSCLDSTDENGDAKVDILVKSDTEESMNMLIRSIQEERREVKTAAEEASKGG